MNTNTQYQHSQPLVFRSRNADIRKADEICRRINKEFPAYSATALETYKNHNATINTTRIYRTVNDLIKLLREYYNTWNKSDSTIRALAGMKKLKVGNCCEKSIATYVALKANGYKDVRNFSLYSISKKTGEIKDLDHVVTAVNFKIPKNYDFNLNRNITEKDFLTPNNKAIIIDSWAGITDNAKEMTSKYRGNITLPRQNISSDEKIVFMPYRRLYIDKDDMNYFRQKYPVMLLDENKNKINNPRYNIGVHFNPPEISDSQIQETKAAHRLRSTRPENEIEKQSIFSFILEMLHF